MYLPTSKCVLCSEQIRKLKYNLKNTYSQTSNLQLIKFVEKLYKNVFLLHCNICTSCYDLLNELDAIQQREKELYSQLKYVISKSQAFGSVKTEPEDIKIDVYEDESELFMSKYLKKLPDKPKDEEEIKIEGIDLKGLPIKVKRIKVNPKKPREEKSNKSNNEKIFEQIQSSIQMDLTKHVIEYMHKTKPIRNVLCEICGQNFKTKSGYDNHMKKHGNVEDEIKLLSLNKSEEKSSCNICGKTFNQKGSLVRHLAIHTGESRYQCEECGKKFLHHSSFTMHKKIHAGQRNFKCDTCNHCFLTNSHLQRHRRSTHDKERNHICEYCSKKFCEHYNLLAHIKLVHEKGSVVEQQFVEEHNVIYQLKENDEITVPNEFVL
ncbi:hypothetical protein ABEB36_013153 [Hypothenemus hampei]|uniref:C2H2-type domain-containing protein n=1 Tax=Hypothenemus hampei TaxID=57062 RepID=A0ABD1E7U5_HYPHA